MKNLFYLFIIINFYNCSNLGDFSCVLTVKAVDMNNNPISGVNITASQFHQSVSDTTTKFQTKRTDSNGIVVFNIESYLDESTAEVLLVEGEKGSGFIPSSDYNRTISGKGNISATITFDSLKSQKIRFVTLTNRVELFSFGFNAFSPNISASYKKPHRHVIPIRDQKIYANLMPLDTTITLETGKNFNFNFGAYASVKNPTESIPLKSIISSHTDTTIIVRF